MDTQKCNKPITIYDIYDIYLENGNLPNPEQMIVYLRELDKQLDKQSNKGKF